MLLAVLIIVLSGFGLRSLGQKSYKTDIEKLTIKKVEKMDFQDKILINATVEPISSILINNPEGGTVEEIFAEDGAMLKKGAPLLKLSNPSTLLVYMTQETAIVEQINNLQNLKLSLERDQRNMEESLLDIEYQLTDKTRVFKKDSSLFYEEIIANDQYKESHDQFIYQQKKHQFLADNSDKIEKDNKIQIKRINRSIEMMERNLKVIRENMDRLLVKAPVAGRLSAFDPVIGESFGSNQTIAKIDVMSGYKVKGSVDEYYLTTVKIGQKGRFNFNGEIVELEVKKVMTEVINGFFEIELIFSGPTPPSITSGQSLQVKLELSETRKTLVLAKGSYFNAYGGKYVFVLNESGQAFKRQIRIGRSNPSYYEILEGLEEGEEVITSSYDTFKEFENITINK